MKIDELVQLRRENREVTREIAEEYFYTLTYLLNGAEQAHLVKTNPVYRMYDQYLLKNNKTYDSYNPEKVNLVLLDYVQAHYYERDTIKIEGGTLLERFPAIEQQIADLLALSPKTKITLHQKGYSFNNSEIHTMSMVQGFIKGGCSYNGFIPFGKDYGSTDYICAPIFENILRVSTFENEKIFDENSIEEQMLIKIGSEIIFPNDQFVKNIREVVQWYRKCKQAGFDYKNLIVRRNARTLAEPEYEDQGLSPREWS